MKLSTKCRYGARAIIEIARGYGDAPVKRKTIASKQNISDSYLKNILVSLKNAGLIRAIRGAEGGYALRRPPSEITFFEIIKALEGDLSPVECLDNPEVCDRIDICTTRDVWKKMADHQEETLKSITVEKLIKDKKKL